MPCKGLDRAHSLIIYYHQDYSLCGLRESERAP